MNNDIVQLTDKSGNNIYPIAGGATQDSISKTMLAEGVFEGPELFPAPSGAYVRTENIVDGAVTSDKIDSTTLYPLIQSGTHYITSAAWETILFPHEFDSIPHIAATLNTQNAETQTATWIKIANISKTGFRAAVGTASSYGTGQVDWIATVL